MSFAIFLACLWIISSVSRRSSGVSSYFSPYSQAPKITDTGVRSSWEASEANCSSAWNDPSSR